MQILVVIEPMDRDQETINDIYSSYEQHLTLLVLCPLAIPIDETS